jgi:Spy/CpxP family protein refolding chaperone
MKTPLRILVVAASLAFAAPLYAQGGGGGGGQQMTPEQRLARSKELLFKDITLTPEVAVKVDTILVQGSRKNQELMTAARSGGGDMTAVREQTRKITTDGYEAIKALLTDEQKKQFEANVAAMPQGRGRGGF